jgi:hypothetical protein
MFRKILITALILVVIGAVSISVYNTSLARSGQAETNNQPVVQEAAQEAIGVSTGLSNVVEGSTNPVTSVENQALAQQPGQSGSAGFGGNAELANLPPATPGELSESEKAALLYMREEEKLAHDVYLALYDRWGLATFQSIANSEQSHMDAIKYLMDRYELEDSSTNQAGKFTNPELQSLYTSLVERGSQSLAEAIKVGGAIEEIDILDLQERLAQTDNTDIQQVFNNLLRGSTSHLKAFVNALRNQVGEAYQPQFMTLEAYQAILSSTAGNGYGRSGGGNGQSGAGGGYRGGRP